MPMIDAFIPDGALAPEAEARLFEELTETLVRLEGFEPTNARARAATWIFLHRPAVFRAGAPASSPRYRFILTVPEGQYDDEICEALVRDVAAAVARAEGGPADEVSSRVWVFPLEVPDGRWGARGAVRRLPDILASLVDEGARRAGEEKLAARRRKTAMAILAAAREGAGVA